MRMLALAAPLAALLSFGTLASAAAVHDTDVAADPAPEQHSSRNPSRRGPDRPARIERVGDTAYRITSIAAASETTVWLAGVDARQRVVVQKMTKARPATAQPKLHAPTTLAATAPRGVQISAVDESEAWLVTSPDPQQVANDYTAPNQTSTELWRYQGRSWARVKVTLPGGPAATAWEVRDTPGRNSALVNTRDQVWRYGSAGLVNASTDIYRDEGWDTETRFEYGIRPTAGGFVAMGTTPMTVNYLRGRNGVVSLLATIGGWALGGQSTPTAWGQLSDSSTLIMHENHYYDVDLDNMTFTCTLWSPQDAATACPDPPAKVTGVLGLSDASVLLSSADGLWRRATPTGSDVAVGGALGRGVAAMGAAPGSRVAWVATKPARGEGSVLARYVVR